jgi:DNA-binding NtrC family response regulator
MPIRVPPLRERVSDIPRLAAHFLEQSARRSKKGVRSISPAAMQALCRYAWPGNVRELENVIERAVIVAKTDTIADVEPFLTGAAGRPRVDVSLPFRDAKARVLEEFERAYVSEVLELHGGKLTSAAKHADMDPKNFHEKLVRHGLRRPAAAE